MNPVFLFDFASPNAYFVHRVIPEIESAHWGGGSTIVPVLLGGLFKLSGNQAPMITNAGVPNKMAYEHGWRSALHRAARADADSA